MPSFYPPLNREGAFQPWMHFDPGSLIDMNPSFVRINPGEAWSVFCRYGARPEPGAGSIWAVRVDTDMRPVGSPISLIPNAIDPRVIAFGGRLLVFFTMLERSPEGGIVGSSVALAEFRVEADLWTMMRSFGLPKNPITGPSRPDSSAEWEKNWVPFAISDTQVGLIYSHDPWNVIVMTMGPDADPAWQTLFTDKGLSWDFGTIRGGTPPIPYEDGTLITFFHSSRVIGSKNVYSVGACVLRSSEPFSPLMQTQTPLLIAPYKNGVNRFGWAFAASVVFPLGAERIPTGYRLLCGRDDGEIASFVVPSAELDTRLEPVGPATRGAFHDFRGKSSSQGAGPVLYVPEPVPGISELPMINFIKVIAGSGRTFVDVGAHIGFYTIALAAGYDRVVSFEPSKFQFKWLQYNKAINSLDHVQLHSSALGLEPGVSTVNVLSQDGGGNSLSEERVAEFPDNAVLDKYTVDVQTLDSLGLSDVDLIKIDVEGFELNVIGGAVDTINTCRPAILIEVWTDQKRRTKVADAMRSLKYTFEPLFPLSPELVLCLPSERREQYRWFV